ncbi:ribosome maturation factor RimP [Paeniglutamicibacter antarcticus]|uniref:Ribosome maturation factor RimP n=1 Tax=Arthrobacter terrae TaxID=2935737 RepID=A0A931G4W5_9MICC|nr:ribosome maturation factor RimP [Arthrobacter terrae]MBG0739273.1 ribosome maturation factor RimP [Arthrobacter terrae]
MTQPNRPNAHGASDNLHSDSPSDGGNLAGTAEARRLFDLLNPTVANHGLFLEDVNVHLAGAHRTVSVVVDLEQNLRGGVGMDVIAAISRELSDVLDADPQDDGRPFDLEVSSPGVGRPLTERRHWYRARGRMVKVNVVAGENVTGRLLEVDDDGVTVRPELTVKKGMKPKQGNPQQIAFDKIRRGTVEVEFSHLDEAGPEAGLHEDFGPTAGAVDGEES